jgi:alkylation response protein AidB-like acyl-CoA dehydrogenase
MLRPRKEAVMPHPYRPDSVTQSLAGSAAQITREVVAPHAAEVDAAARFPKESLDALAAAGFFGLCLPESAGGKNQGPRGFAAVVEELAQGCSSTAMIYVMHVSAAQAIGASSLGHKSELLRQIAAGKHLTTLALSEKGSRSNFWAPVSKLAAHGDGFSTSAQKSWVTSARHADSYVSDGQKPGAASPLESTVYFIKRDSPGVRVTSSFDGLGLRGNDSAPVTIEGAHLTSGDLMTDQGAGAKLMLEVILPWFAVGTAAMAHGLSLAALGATLQHVSETHTEHDGRALRDLPNLRARVARMSLSVERSRALLGRCLDEMEAQSPMAPLFVLEARLSALESALEVTDLAMKACGGAAFSRQLGVERLFRDARAGWVMAPTVDHLEDFIGKALTGLPLF